MPKNIRKLAPTGSEGFTATKKHDVVVIDYLRFDEDDKAYMWRDGEWKPLPWTDRGAATADPSFSYLQCDVMTQVGLIAWGCAVMGALAYLVTRGWL